MLGLPYTMVRFLPALKEKEEIQEIFYTVLFHSAVYKWDRFIFTLPVFW